MYDTSLACMRKRSTGRTHTHTPTENNTPDTHTHTHTRQEQDPKPANEHLPQTLNNAVNRIQLCDPDCSRDGGREAVHDIVGLHAKNINRSHTHAHTDREQHPRHTHTHTTRTTPQTPKRTPPTNA